jgi:thioester reductase-like protein
MCWADRNLEDLGDFDAFVAGGRVWRSMAAHDQGARIASGLAAMGVAPGDRVLLWLPNGPELVMSWRAVLRAGGVAVVAHHDAPLQRIEQLAAETAPTAIVACAARLGSEVEGVAVRHRIQADPEEERPGWYSVRRILAEHRPLIEPVARSGRDLAYIMFTSGTTGRPKGIVTRHDALASRLRSVRNSLAPWRRPLRRLAVLPMSSSFGSGLLFEGLAKKCTLYFLDRFDPEQVLETIQTRRIQWVSLVPTMCEAILAVADAGRYDLSSLATVVCGGANVPPALVERFRKTLGIRLKVGYGMSGIGTVSMASFRTKPGSVGRPGSHLRAKVVDPEGRQLPAGEVGELVLHAGDKDAFEYWNPDSSVTAAADPDGWYRTGDLVHFDAHGELYVVGRSDDLIIQGGHNIHAQTIAEIVQRLAGVRECAAVGIPNEYLGQEAVACVALHDGARVTAGDVITHCRKNLEVRAVPASVWFVEALPLNELGKVKGHELRAAIQAARGAVCETDLVRQLGAASASVRRELLRKQVQRLLGQVLRGSVHTPAPDGAAFRDMGLDSLGAVELTHALSEAFGRQLPMDLTYTHPTIDAVCDFLLETLGWESGPGHNVSANSPAPTRAEEVRLADFFSPLDLDAARRSTPARRLPHGAQAVFLTGANGFLGRFLVLEILRRLVREGGMLNCLVRAPNDSSAFDRLRAAYATDPSLQDLFVRLSASGRLAVFGGDLTQPRFGLPKETYARLCGEVDCIVHNGAVVDHVLGYAELFAPNVLGTVEIVRFAVAQRIKPVNYVSTIAVRGLARKAFFSHRNAAAAGYSASKWAGERLLRELHDRLGVPARVYRPSRILAHSEYPGQINIEDAFTRLLHGIVTTSLAPRSFYARRRPAKGGNYDGLPVDAVARSIAALSTGPIERPGYIEYHVVNPHRGADLDVIVDWVKSAGYRIERIDDYAAWYRAFENRLRALSRPKRQYSLLPLIHTWERPMRNGATRYDTERFHRHLAQLAEIEATEGLAEIPPIGEAFIHKCLADMCALGLIEPAG